MRKVVHAIYGMFRHEQPFDNVRVYPLPHKIPAPNVQPKILQTEGDFNGQQAVKFLETCAGSAASKKEGGHRPRAGDFASRPRGRMW
jgi:hypothetical protein